MTPRRAALYIVRGGEYLDGDGFQLVETSEGGDYETPGLVLPDGHPLAVIATTLFIVGGKCIEVPRTEFLLAFTAMLCENGRLWAGDEAEFLPTGTPPEGPSGPWYCYDNARLLAAQNGGQVWIGVGLHSDDGWTLHTWVRRSDGTLVEPTSRPIAYFGFSINDGGGFHNEWTSSLSI